MVYIIWIECKGVCHFLQAPVQEQAVEMQQTVEYIAGLPSWIEYTDTPRINVGGILNA